MADVNLQASHPEYSYDLVPYESQPFAQSQPDQTAAMAKLFGMSPVDPAKARVLELGCSAGGNIISLAARYPGMQVTGIELSRVEVEQGQRMIKELGLKNIEIRQANILDVAKEKAQYDYIIAHGVYSWVPEQVQDAILQICGDQLSENGIAYISYNVYPGWKMREVIREMMLFHAGGLTDPKAKLQQGRAILEYAKKINSSDSAFGKLLSQEADLVMKANDYYLFHDHMEENNNPCYFKDFATRAAVRKLAYLGEANLTDMAPQRFGGDIPQTLAMLSNGSILATEQYMDLFTNRMFRQTLLVRQEQASKLVRALNPQSVRHLHVSASLIKDTAPPPSGTLGVYRDQHGRTLTVGEASMQALADALVEAQPFTVSVDDTVALLRKRGYGADQSDELLAEAVGSHILTLLLQGMVKSYFKPQSPVTVGDKPLAFAPARQAALDPSAVRTNGIKSLPNRFHQASGLNEVQWTYLGMLDGKRTEAQVQQEFLQFFRDGRFTANQNGAAVTDESAVAKVVDEFCKAALKDFVRLGLMA
jgi:methyltransferase-like protein/cyclopropane fatty-acyl-phospholipid synthase-like methyltransferase